MKKLLLLLTIMFAFLASGSAVYAHGDDDDDDEHAAPPLTAIHASANTHAVISMPPDTLPMEIIPNWHPLFVHFTIALLLTATLLFVLFKCTPVTASWRTSCLSAARWNLWLGVLITLGTIAAGWYAFNTVNHDNHAHLPILSHRLWGLSTATTFVALALWAFIERRKEPSLVFIFCLLIASGALAMTGYKGGELVYRHGLGVMAMPEKDDHMGHHGNMPQMKDMPGM